jgi:hypothetical protein
LLAIDLHCDLVNEEDSALTSVLSFQSACINGAELNIPETDGFSGYGDDTFSKDIFNIAAAGIEAIVEPDGVENDIA